MGYSYENDVAFSTLLGKTIIKIDNNGSDELKFYCETGEEYVMYHSQNCCESVSIDDIDGNLNDLLNSPILQAEEVTDNTPKKETINKGEENEYTFTDESATWTFYKLATVKGYVTIKWYGTSNGYYSESVSFNHLNQLG